MPPSKYFLAHFKNIYFQSLSLWLVRLDIVIKLLSRQLDVFIALFGVVLVTFSATLRYILRDALASVYECFKTTVTTL